MEDKDFFSVVCEACGNTYNISKRYAFSAAYDDAIFINCSHCKRDDVISFEQEFPA